MAVIVKRMKNEGKFADVEVGQFFLNKNGMLSYKCDVAADLAEHVGDFNVRVVGGSCNGEKHLFYSGDVATPVDVEITIL